MFEEIEWHNVALKRRFKVRANRVQGVIGRRVQNVNIIRITKNVWVMRVQNVY